MHISGNAMISAGSRGLGYKVPNAPEVVRLVTGLVLKLYCRHADVAHFP